MHTAKWQNLCPNRTPELNVVFQPNLPTKPQIACGMKIYRMIIEAKPETIKLGGQKYLAKILSKIYMGDVDLKLML